MILKILGFLYFLLHVAILVFAATYGFLCLTVAPCGADGLLILVIPLFGLAAGHFIRRGKFGFWRVSLIAVSVFLSAGLVFMSFFVPAVLKKPAQAAPAAAGLDIPLIEAARNGRTEEVRRLLDQGVSLKAKNEFGESVLHVVRDPGTAKFLIDRGADVGAREDMDGMTPLFAQDGEILRILVDAGADVNARSAKGNTPLIWHAYGKDMEGIRYLLSKGADINAVNADDSTALDIAERFSEQELIAFLKSLGAKTAAEVRAGK
ncbi:MAG: ankyrin repeat domain-containing protein [Candidatus Omnitrophica bacterium]|nr:ankyrin repeat domain-containing protein [Candidatus Omnitrophota bacterium]